MCKSYVPPAERNERAHHGRARELVWTIGQRWGCGASSPGPTPLARASAPDLAMSGLPVFHGGTPMRLPKLTATRRRPRHCSLRPTCPRVVHRLFHSGCGHEKHAAEQARLVNCNGGNSNCGVAGKEANTDQHLLPSQHEAGWTLIYTFGL